MFLVLKY